MQTEDNTKNKTTKFLFFGLLRCSLTYQKLMQTEDNTKNKTTKFFIFWIVEVQLISRIAIIIQLFELKCGKRFLGILDHT